MAYLSSVALKLERSSPELETFPYTVPAIRSLLEPLKFHPKCTFLVGENGTGKSTLLEAIAVRYGFNPEGGTKNFSFNTRQSHSKLFEYIQLYKEPRRARDGFFLRAESFFNLATEIERLDEEPGPAPKVIDSYGGKSLHEQSHGESFFSLFRHRFGGHGMYILDEPEAALSPSRQLAFLVRMNDLIRQNSQFVIATHSPIILAYRDAWIYQLDEEGMQRTPYEKTNHYDLTRRFLNNPDRMLEQLLADE